MPFAFDLAWKGFPVFPSALHRVCPTLAGKQILRRKQSQVGARPGLLKSSHADGALGEQREVPAVPAPGNEARALLEQGYGLGFATRLLGPCAPGSSGSRSASCPGNRRRRRRTARPARGRYLRTHRYGAKYGVFKRYNSGVERSAR